MTVKLLWFPGLQWYGLEVFAGANTQRRRFVGQLVFTPAEAVWFRMFVLGADVGLLDRDVSEAGWVEPAVPSSVVY